MDTPTTQHQAAEDAMGELLRKVRELGGDRPGAYTVHARLRDDGTYAWHWDWWPQPDDGRPV